MIDFYVGIHHPSTAQHFDCAFISINVLRTRKSGFKVGRWILDSGAFSEVSKHGGYRHAVSEYADQIRRWATVGTLECAVAQDFMCEPHIVERTGLSVAEHQRLTIERYDDLVAEELPVPIMPVLQGYHPASYVRHLRAYQERLHPGMRVGVGSVCRRNGKPDQIVDVLAELHRLRPDLKLHGFGVKRTSLLHPGVRDLLHSSDSMAWSYHARKNGRNADDWREAKAFEQDVLRRMARPFSPWQISLPMDAPHDH